MKPNFVSDLHRIRIVAKYCVLKDNFEGRG